MLKNVIFYFITLFIPCKHIIGQTKYWTEIGKTVNMTYFYTIIKKKIKTNRTWIG